MALRAWVYSSLVSPVPDTASAWKGTSSWPHCGRWWGVVGEGAQGWEGDVGQPSSSATWRCHAHPPHGAAAPMVLPHAPPTCGVPREELLPELLLLLLLLPEEPLSEELLLLLPLLEEEGEGNAWRLPSVVDGRVLPSVVDGRVSGQE